jgi:hypothetical protein
MGFLSKTSTGRWYLYISQKYGTISFSIEILCLVLIFTEKMIKLLKKNASSHVLSVCLEIMHDWSHVQKPIQQKN